MEFFSTHIGQAAIDNAMAVLRSGWVSEGVRVADFEDALTQRLGMVNPLALNSGTSALHLALAVAGVGSGDEVIIPPQTFVATGLAVLMQGASLVFADVDPESGNILPASISEKVTPRTRAVMPVHWGGCPCDMDEINALANRHGIAVIEDAAHALGATYHSRPVGSLSRFTCFSFQAIKHLTTGDGGALCCLDQTDYEKARCLRWFGIDRAQSKPSILGERIFDIDTVGYKYHMNDLAAAIGLGNLEDFPTQMERRRAIVARYQTELADVPGLRFLKHYEDRESAWWVFTVRVERREDFVRALQSRGATASVLHLRIDRFAVFGGQRDDLPGQDLFDREQVALPLHSQLTDSEIDKIIDAVRAGW